MSACNHIYKLIPEHQYVVVPTYESFTEICIKLIKEYIFKPKIQLSKEEYARKRIHNGCLMQIESPVSQDNL